jgi:hypothetical protein
MSGEKIEVGAFTWGRVQRLYDADPEVHWQRCETEGLECPLDVFVQLFHAEEVASVATRSGDVRPGIPRLLELGSLRAVDWGRVRWELEEFSGVALRRVSVDRGFQHALDEARDQATQFGIVDDRPEVVEHWSTAHSWLVPPVMVAGEVLGTNIGYELLVGFTRLGNSLGLLDRQEIAEIARHLVWVGNVRRANG